MKIVTFKCNRVRYDLILASRLNIVIGKSGQGKSRLAHTAQIAMRLPELASLTGVKSIAGATSRDWWEAIEGDSELVVIDEGAMLECTEDIIRAMKEHAHLYLVMCRSGLPELLLEPYCVFDMERISDSYYRMVCQAENVTEFLSLYKDTMGKEFTGTVPACVHNDS